MRGTDRLAKDYGRLTGEERFRLISAASGRGDEGERDRLVRAAGKLRLTFPDHMPFAQAMGEMSHLTYLELVEDAARYRDALDRAAELDGAAGDEGAAKPSSRRCNRAFGRAMDAALAVGYALKAKADGWGLFCTRLGASPFLLWEGFPGFERLSGSLELAVEAAFTQAEFLRWLNRVRPEGAAEVTAVALTPEAVAEATEGWFRERAEWWGG